MTGQARAWRRYVVCDRVQESASVLSLRLEPADDAALAPFAPGQFLTFRIADGEGRAVPRNYSLSGDPADRTGYRVSVRREPSGTGSAAMHAAHAGTVLEASGPKGDFVLDEASRRPVILVSAGIGVTPIMAMAHALARDSERDAFLIHQADDGQERPFEAQLRALAARAPNLRIALGLPAGDPSAAAADFAGPVDARLLRALLPIGDYEAYLCGPQAFLQAMFDLLLDLGVREERIRHETFGPRRPLTRGGARAEPDAAAAAAAGKTDAAEADAPGSDAAMVVFSASGRSAPWDGSHRSLLDFAEAQGLQPAFSCRNGICNTCLCEIDGKVRYVEEPLETPAPGYALLCCSAPDGPISLRL